MDWSAIAAAFALVRAGTINRVDGEGWKLYCAGTIIRLDITAAD